MNALDTNVLVYAADSAEPVKQNQVVELLLGLSCRKNCCHCSHLMWRRHDRHCIQPSRE